MSKSEMLRILTLNTWGIVWPIGKDVIPRARAIGGRFSSLDVELVALQEVWTEKARSVFLEAGHAAGFTHAWPNSDENIRGGLMVLSKLPIEQSRFSGFELDGIAENIHHSDYWGGKGFAQLVVATPDGELELIDTKLNPDQVHWGEWWQLSAFPYGGFESDDLALPTAFEVE